MQGTSTITYSKILFFFKHINPFYWLARHRERKLQTERHRIVAQHVTDKSMILDVGGSKRANLGKYISNDVIILNNAPIMKATILGDACELPIRDKAFSVVVAIQIFHQIASEKRGQFISELRRVSQNKIIIHDYQTGDSYEDLKKLMPDARSWKLSHPYRLIIYHLP